MGTTLDRTATTLDRTATTLDRTATTLDRTVPSRFRPVWRSPVTTSAGLERRAERVLAMPGAQGTV
jgi:hypothetical protein